MLGTKVLRLLEVPVGIGLEREEDPSWAWVSDLGTMKRQRPRG